MPDLPVIRVPWPKTQKIAPKAVMVGFFGEGLDVMDNAKVAWPALKAPSSVYGPNRVPDLMPFLPLPEHPDCPTQAFGMHVLEDQAPRLLWAVPLSQRH